jgi:hypothetical protein
MKANQASLANGGIFSLPVLYLRNFWTISYRTISYTRHQSWPTPLVVENDRQRKVSFSQTAMSNGIENPATYLDEDALDSAKESQTPKSTCFNDLEQLESIKYDVRKILDVLHEKWKPTDDSDGFLWRYRCPKGIYHADTTVQSLEDTPQVFKE